MATTVELLLLLTERVVFWDGSGFVLNTFWKFVQDKQTGAKQKKEILSTSQNKICAMFS